MGFLSACLVMLAAPYQGSTGRTVSDEPEDTIVQGVVREYTDSILQEIERQREKVDRPDFYRQANGIADSIEVDESEPYAIHLIARAYEDRVTLRWAPSEYVPFRYLRDAGYVVTRSWGTRKDGFFNDTLAIVKPWPMEQFKQKFAENDSLAGVAVQLMYGQLTPSDQTEAAPGSMKSIVEMYEQQQEMVGFAMYVAELRPDLAEAMGLLYTDRDVRPDIDYIYSVAPNLPDSVLHILWGTSEVIRVGKAPDDQLRLDMSDSVSAPAQVIIYWPRLPFSAYDIERRDNGGEWHQLNDKPYISFVTERMDENSDNFYADNVEKQGTYEYRLYAYNSFGDRIGPSEPYRVEVPDMVPPQPPTIDQFQIVYVNDSIIQATILMSKDSLEEDLVGYVAMYRNDLRDTTAQWRQLSDHVYPPGTTSCLVDVSGLSAGHVAISAFDRAGNYSYSVEQLLNIDDFTPPSPPTNLRANVAPDGLLVLRWSAPPEPDVAFYEVYAANESTDLFMNRTNADQRDTVYVDSLAQGLNQAYIYYRVKAVDGSGNSSDFSDILPVVRPNYIPPQVCRIDSVWMNDDEINMWWIQSNEVDISYHRLFRKLDTEDTWTLMGVYRADSLRYFDNRIRFKDSPKPNMKTRYVYAVETYNLTGVTSGLSMPQTFLFTGPRIVSVSLKLQADYNKRDHETKLAWETGRVPDYNCGWYYCVYRKGPDDPDFKFLLATKSDEPQFNDFLNLPGTTAQYYVMVQYDDGRRSKPSNVVTITAPKE